MSNPVDRKSKQDMPEAAQIEAMLSQFKPQPSGRFYHRMSNAPWTKTHPRGTLVFLNKLDRKFVLGTAAFLLILTLVCLSFIPSIRAIARQIIYSFISAPSNELEIQVTLSNPGELFHFSDPANFTLRVNDIQQQAGFPVKQLTTPPEGLVLVGARFDPSYYAVTLLYQANDYKLFLTQRLIDNGEDVFSIGSSAKVELVMIGDNKGEYVAGGWKAISTQTIPGTSTPGTQTNISAIWDDNLSQYTLRWQADGFIYELRSIGDGSPSQSELITLANGVK